MFYLRNRKKRLLYRKIRKFHAARLLGTLHAQTQWSKFHAARLLGAGCTFIRDTRVAVRKKSGMNLLFVQMAVRIGGHVNFLPKNLDFPVIPDFQGSKKLKKEEEKHGFN